MKFGPKTLLSVAMASSLLLAGCANDGNSQNREQGNQTQQVTPTPRATFVPGGSAEENKRYFDQTMEELLAQNSKADSHAIVNALADAGFDKSRMEVTFDRTTIDLEADYIIVSVKMPDEMCLIGERGTRGYSSGVAKPMSTDKCLIGQTQIINW